MRCLALYFIVSLSSPLSAQEEANMNYTYGNPVWFEPLENQSDGAIGHVVFHNRIEYGGATNGGPSILYDHIIATPWGPIMLEREVTKENSCPLSTCPDSITLEDWPLVLLPEALTLTVDENDTQSIRLYYYGGS